MTNAWDPVQLGDIELPHRGGDEELVTALRAARPDGLIFNRADADVTARLAGVEGGLADVASFSRMAIANPDLAERIHSRASLNEADPNTFYGGDVWGYTDYPTMEVA